MTTPASATRRQRHHLGQVSLLMGVIVVAVVIVAGLVVVGGRAGPSQQFAAVDQPPPVAPTIEPAAAPSPSSRPTSPTPTAAASPTFGPTPTAPPTPTPEAVTIPPIPPIQAPATRGMLHVPPTKVEIPELGIASDLVALRLNPGGSLQVPEDYDQAGWYADGPYPGEINSPPAVIVGHVDSTTGPAIFYRLREIAEGDEIRVTRSDGSVAVFKVGDATQYPKSELPAAEVYRDRQPSELVLITCSGEFDQAANSYLDNFVVTAQLDRHASGLEP